LRPHPAEFGEVDRFWFLRLENLVQLRPRRPILHRRVELPMRHGHLQHESHDAPFGGRLRGRWLLPRGIVEGQAANFNLRSFRAWEFEKFSPAIGRGFALALACPLLSKPSAISATELCALHRCAGNVLNYRYDA